MSEPPGHERHGAAAGQAGHARGGDAARRQVEARRRRTLAAVALVAVVGIVVALIAGGKSGSSSRARTSPASSSRSASSVASSRSSAPAARLPQVSIAQTGTLPLALQDAAAVATGPEDFLLVGGIDRSEASVADILRVSATRSSTAAPPSSPLSAR